MIIGWGLTLVQIILEVVAICEEEDGLTKLEIDS